MGAIFNASFLTMKPGTVGRALGVIESWMPENAPQGRLLACWFSEIGLLNRIMLLQAYDDDDAVARDRGLITGHANPFGIGDDLLEFSVDTFTPFPGLAEPAVGAVGPFFEVRCYNLRSGGLRPTFDAWAKVLADRVKVSPLLIAMHANSGTMPRIIHIWPYRSLDERLQLRNRSVEIGVWPPPNGLLNIVRMQSEIYMPAAFSALR